MARQLTEERIEGMSVEEAVAIVVNIPQEQMTVYDKDFLRSRKEYLTQDQLDRFDGILSNQETAAEKKARLAAEAEAQKEAEAKEQEDALNEDADAIAKRKEQLEAEAAEKKAAKAKK